MAVINKRSVMTIFSNSNDMRSHRARIVLAEKGVTYDVVTVDGDDKPEDLLDLNPYGTVPTLVDRELVLYQSRIIMEYLDERFPHPPLLPIYPVARAKSRLIIHRIDNDWYTIADKIMDPDYPEAKKQALREELKGGLLSIASVFANNQFFLNEDFSLVDCCMAPLLWRLPSMKISLDESSARHIVRYAEKLFSRDSFKASLSDVESEMRAEENC